MIRNILILQPGYNLSQVRNTELLTLSMIFQLLRHSEKNILNNFSFGYLITKTQIVFTITNELCLLMSKFSETFFNLNFTLQLFLQGKFNSRYCKVAKTFELIYILSPAVNIAGYF